MHCKRYTMCKSHLLIKDLQRDKTWCMSSGRTLWCENARQESLWTPHEENENASCDTLQGMRKKCLPQFHNLNTIACCITNPSCALAPQQTLFGLSVTEAVLSAAQADTLHSLALGFPQSESCDHSRQCSMAGRHLHHMRFVDTWRRRSACRSAPPPLPQRNTDTYVNAQMQMCMK